LREVIVPKLAGGLSAVGGMYSDITAVFSRGRHTLSSDFDYDGANAALEELDEEMREFLEQVQHEGQQSVQFGCEARYDQQMWEIDVSLGERGRFASEGDVATLKADFDKNHLALFSMQQPESPIEVITWRGEARVVRGKPRLTAEVNGSNGAAAPSAPVPTGTRRTYFGGRAMDAAIFAGEDLAPGMRIASPAVIEEPTTTIVLPPGSSCLVRPSHYLIEIAQDD
jgi:N-methylhydantoinase A